MAGKRDKPEDIVMKLRQVEVLQEQGMSGAEAVRRIGVTQQTYSRWRRQYGGMSRDQLKRLKELEKENARLRRAVSDLTFDKLRLVPLHAKIEEQLAALPEVGPLFPELTVNIVTKRFSDLRDRLGLKRPGLVFHSTRKWFITQCERTGVPEHFTASLVGHKSARSENQLTYGIYSAGISDEQKRAIIDQIRLPQRVAA